MWGLQCSAGLVLGPFAWASGRRAVDGPLEEIPVRLVGLKQGDEPPGCLGLPNHVFQLKRVAEAVGVEICLARHLDTNP